MKRIVQSESTAARRRLPIKMVSSTDGVTEVPSLTLTVQVRKNSGAWAAAAGTVSEPGGAGNGQGSYEYEATQAELDTIGILEYRATGTAARRFDGCAQIEAANFNLATSGRLDVNIAAVVAGIITNAAFAANAISASKVNTDLDARVVDATWDEGTAGHAAAGSFGERLGTFIGSTIAADGGNTALTFKTNLSSTTTNKHRNLLIVFVTGALAGDVQKVSAYNGTTNFITVVDAFTAAPGTGDRFLLINA